MMEHEHEQGICPKCGSDGLTYGDTKKQDIALGYEYICEDCGFIGIEWYNLHFTEHTAPDCVAVIDSDIKNNDHPVKTKKEFFMVLSDKIMALSESVEMPVDRLNLDITLSQAMTEENRADMSACMESNKNDVQSEAWILAQVMHDIKGFKEQHLSNKPTGFAARTSGYANRQHVIIFVEGGLVQCVTSTHPDIGIIVADKDNIESEEDEAAYNRLVSLSESDGYTEIY